MRPQRKILASSFAPLRLGVRHSEQHRIVTKVDELMMVCDQLEAQLNATQTDSRRLLEAILQEALA